MKKRLMTCLLLALAGSAHAEKIEKEFKQAFERTFRLKQSFAVVQQAGIPTSSVLGKEGNQSAAHFSIDVQGGRWKESEGLFDIGQAAVDVLSRGEIMELNSIGYHDNRIDMRFVSIEAHKVKRGEWPFRTEKRESVATNFKFFLPFDKSHKLTPADVPAVLDYIDVWLRAFPDEREARVYAGSMLSSRESDAPRGGASRSAAARRGETSSSEAGRSEKKEIKLGMTPLEVIDILGRPQKEVSFENTTRWTYPDLTVIFENGKVKEVRF